MADRKSKGSPPFVEADEMVFATDVTLDQRSHVGFRGEAEEGNLKPTHGSPKAFGAEDGIFDKGGKV